MMMYVTQMLVNKLQATSNNSIQSNFTKINILAIIKRGFNNEYDCGSGDRSGTIEYGCFELVERCRYRHTQGMEFDLIQ